MLKRTTEKILGATLVLVFWNIGLTSVLASETKLLPRHQGSHRPVIKINPEKPTFSIMKDSKNKGHIFS